MNKIYGTTQNDKEGTETMKDPFHEAKVALLFSAEWNYAVNSVCATAAYSINQSCENSVRALYETATGNDFPHEKIKPSHKPASWLQQAGVIFFYSTESRKFLDKITGYDLDEVRYEGTQAYKDHIKPTAANRGKVLIEGTKRFIEETEQLTKNEDVMRKIRDFDRNLPGK